MFNLIVKYFLTNFRIFTETSMRVRLNVQLSNNSVYIKAISGYMNLMLRRFFNIINHFELFYIFSPDYWERRKYIKQIHDITNGIIKQRKLERKHMKEDAVEIDNWSVKKKKVFLDLLLESNQFTNEEIREEVDTFAFAVCI